jgi:hypothetical protein
LLKAKYHSYLPPVPHNLVFLIEFLFYCSLILGNSFSIVFENHGLGIRLQGFVKNQYVRN